MANEDPCPQCNGEGWIDDPLSSACGGRWFRYCECHAGEVASEEDQVARNTKRQRQLIPEVTDVKQMWAEARERNHRWRECPKHRFPEQPGGYRLGEKPRCLVCGVDAKMGDIGDYIRGYQAAGGDATDIMPDWEP